ncbi:aspartate kinase [bacterium]|nr:aspartate kinase [bacterium]
MRVFKFGGASVKNADAVRNVGEVLKAHTNSPTLVVISAMGKTTNMLEELCSAYYHNKKEKKDILKKIKKFHSEITDELIQDEFDYYEVDNLFIELECIIEKRFDKKTSYDALYDRIVSFGELISTKIVSTYLNRSGYKNRWIDARNFVITNEVHRAANVLWDTSVELMNSNLKSLVKRQTVISQGFIGRNERHETTTLGREGSDYSAAIFAYALNADSVTIWKDVEGVMNADPKRFDKTVLIEQMSYNEAIELAYYGASVIHPKTIQPLKSKGIPLYVKSFLNPSLKGSSVLENDDRTLNDTECYIVKENQCIFSIASRDYSFIAENNLERIFSAFAKERVQSNLMQNTAISFKACLNYEEDKIDRLKEELKEWFHIEVKKDLKLFTVFNYHEKKGNVPKLIKGHKIVLEQKSNFALQLVLEH